MTHERLHALTDGIFAIVMTLLVLEVKVPTIAHELVSNRALLDVLANQGVVLLSYLLSFMMCFMYWRAHNFIVTRMAKNLTATLVNLNMLFLFLVGLVPFSSHFLGEYAETQVGIAVYSLNIIAIGLTLLAMRFYVDQSDKVTSEKRSRAQQQNALIRVFTPIVCAVVAIPLSFASPTASLVVLLLGVAFNLPSNSATMLRRLLHWQEARD